MLRDLGGKHGTTVNGQKMDAVVALNAGDTIQFGKVRESIFRVQWKEGTAVATTASEMLVRIDTRVESAKIASACVSPTAPTT